MDANAVWRLALRVGALPSNGLQTTESESANELQVSNKIGDANGDQSVLTSGFGLFFTRRCVRQSTQKPALLTRGPSMVPRPRLLAQFPTLRVLAIAWLVENSINFRSEKGHGTLSPLLTLRELRRITLPQKKKKIFYDNASDNREVRSQKRMLGWNGGDQSAGTRRPCSRSWMNSTALSAFWHYRESITVVPFWKGFKGEELIWGECSMCVCVWACRT